MKTLIIFIMFFSVSSFAAICSCDATPECGKKPFSCGDYDDDDTLNPIVTTIKCADPTGKVSFKIETKETVKQDSYGRFIFPVIVKVDVTESSSFGQVNSYQGNLIFLSILPGLTKHGRMAQYIFKLSATSRSSNLFSNQFKALELAVYGIDEEVPIRCKWL